MGNESLDELLRSGTLSRRDVLRRAAALGLSLPAISALLAACGGDDDDSSDSSGSDESSSDDTAADNGGGDDSGGSGEVIVYGFYGPWLDKVGPMFEEETGIKFTHLGTYSSNDEWWAKLNAGEEFDFFIPTTDWLQRAMAADLVAPLDMDTIPNYSNLMDDYKNMEYYEKDGETYAVPFTRVYYSLTYNTDRIAEAPDSWAITWDEQYKGQITLQDSAYARVAIAALLLGDDPNAPTMWEEIKAKLLEQKPLVKKYWTDYQNGMELYVNDQVTVGQLTAGRTRMAQDLGAPVEWTVPKEGVMIFIDTFAVPKNAPNKENGYKFINFLMRPDIMAIEMEEMGYDTVNAAAHAELSEEQQARFAPPEGAKLVLNTNIPAETRQRIDELWTEVKLS